jgi:hypothetical protein
MANSERRDDKYYLQLILKHVKYPTQNKPNLSSRSTYHNLGSLGVMERRVFIRPTASASLPDNLPNIED